MEKKTEHINSIRVYERDSEIAIPSKPEIFGIESMFFSDLLTLHIKSYDESSELKYEAIISRKEKLSGEPVGVPEIYFTELSEDENIDISDLPEGNYILSVRAYKTVADFDEILPIYSDESTANFSIVKKEAMHKAIGYEDGIAKLKSQGLFSSSNDSFNEYIKNLLDVKSFKEGLFLAFSIPWQDKEQYHESIVTICGKKYPVIYEDIRGEESSEGERIGLFYVPKVEIPEATEETKIKIETFEYSDNKKTVLLDEYVEEGLISELGGFFVSFEKNSTSIFMTEPKSGESYMHVKIIFNDVNLASITCAYEIISEEGTEGIKIMKDNSISFILNAPGKYTVKAYLFASSDKELKSPISTYEKTYEISDNSADFEVYFPAAISRGDIFNVKICGNDEAKFKVSIKKYVHEICGVMTSDGITCDIQTDILPLGLHVLLITEKKPDGREITISKQFEVLEEGGLNSFNLPHYKKIAKEDTTFVFSGHNIKYFALLAMESFAKRCSIDKRKMIYFDDLSTDGTKEELEKRGYTVLSWDEESLESYKGSDLNNNSSVRKDCIIYSVLKTVSSRYICFIDGDTFCEGDVLDKVLNHIFLAGSSGKQFDVFAFTSSLYKEGDFTLPDIGKSISYNLLWVNRDAVIRENIFKVLFSDIISLKERIGSILFEKLFCSGNNAYLNLRNSSLNIVLIGAADDKLSALDKSFTHVEKVSTSIRDYTKFKGDWKCQLQNVQAFLDREDVRTFSESLGVDINSIKFEYYSKILKDFRKKMM